MLKKKLIYIFILAAVIFIILFQPTRIFVHKIAADFFYPFFSLTLNVKNIVSQKVLLRKDKSTLISELFDLQKTNSILSAKCQHFETLVNENNRLRNLLGLKANPYYNYIFAEIIYRDPVEWFNRFTINKGTDDGIEEGAIVLAKAKAKNEAGKPYFAVAGRIGSVSKHTATVNTVVSDECNLSVFIPENGATGVLMGGGRIGHKLWSKISYLPRDLVYRPSSLVLTSGMNSLLTPANLEVGNITGTDSADVSIYNNLFAEAKFEPVVELNHLNFILILVKK